MTVSYRHARFSRWSFTMPRQTRVAISGDDFLINDEPTYPGRQWRGHRVEGLLLNSRMVQGIFDDLNPETRRMWDYPAEAPGGEGPWNPDRNTDAFVAAMPSWREHGLLAFTLNLQGGSPQGYSRKQPWHNSAFDEKGALREPYFDRLRRILDRADELGMVCILGYFYFGQDQRLRHETAVRDAVDHATGWLLDAGYRHVLVEINNECNVRYDHDVLKPGRVHELIERVRRLSDGRLPVSTSYGGNKVVEPNVAAASDFVLLHGNGVNDPARIAEMVRQSRAVKGYHGQPIVFNEDDHYGFDRDENNLTAAVSEHASWGFFDYRREGESFVEGYQSVPTDWRINSGRKRGFFQACAAITGNG
jgi:hypothetical protein